MTNSGVYIISDINEKVKIGVATDFKNRISSIQTSNSSAIKVEGIIPIDNKSDRVKLEKHLHKVFSKYNIRGEWFDISMLDIMLELKRLGLHEKVTLL